MPSTSDADKTKFPSTAKGRWARLRYEFLEKNRKTSLGESVLEVVRDLRRMREKRVQGTSTFQSINYTVVDNATNRERLRHLSLHDMRDEKRREFVLLMLVGLFAGLATVLLMQGIELVHGFHTRLFMGLWQNAAPASYLTLVVPNAVLFMASAAIVLFWMPPAAGSGIPEVKAYLNGILLPHAWGPKVFLAKFVSCLLACSAGLPVGPEGPIIYLGGNIGMFMTSLPVLNCIGLRYTNALQRTSITLGVAAGVGAAFSAPIGAVLFVVEEVASIFTTSLLWLGFICSFTSYFVTILLGRELFSGNGKEFSTKGIFAVGQIEQWKLWEIPNFVVLGLLLGLLGSLFNIVNVKLVNTRWRKHFVKVNRKRQVLEVAGIALLVSSLWFLLPKLVPCMNKDEAFAPSNTTATDELRESVTSLWCEDPEQEYNPLATLMFGSMDDVVKYLFTSTSGGKERFPGFILFLYSSLFYAAACFIAGSAMATGIFVPMIVIGAGFGSSYSCLLRFLMPSMGLDMASYAVVGAAGFIGGVTRISVAITVIMLEISNDLGLLLPIMLTTGIAKFTGDFLTDPYFEMVLHMRHVPFIEPEPGMAFKQLRCYQVMQRPVVSLPVVVKVMDVLKVMSECTHNGFPIVESKTSNKLCGVITRAHLEYILSNLEPFLDDADELSRNPVTAKLTNHYLATHKGLKGEINSIFESMDAMYLGRELDLHRWMSRAPVTIHQLNSLEQAFFTFKTFGLRQLIVTNSEHFLVGILTRHELFHIQVDPGSYRHQTVQHHEDFAQIRGQQSAGSLDTSPMSSADGASPANGRRRPVIRRARSSREWGEQDLVNTPLSASSRGLPLLEPTPEGAEEEDDVELGSSSAQQS